MLLSEKPVPRIFGGGWCEQARQTKNGTPLAGVPFDRFKLNLFGPISEGEQRRLDAGSRSECQG